MAFEAILEQQDARPKRWRQATLILSVALHVVALAAALVRSVWQVDEMPMPSLQVSLTAALPPPPPPPPPAARKASAESRPKTRIEPKPQELVVPKETPKEQPKAVAESDADSASDHGEEGGQVGGQVGGVTGGVVGGVVGAPPPPPPPPKPAGPKNVSASVGRGQLLIDPNAERYRVKLPLALARTGETYVALLRLCVSAEGSVTSVQVMKGAGAALDGQFPSVMGRWRYRPLIADGVPTPFCYLLRYEVSGR